MRHLLIAITVMALVATSFAAISQAEEEAPMITVTRLGNGSTEWTVDEEGNWTNWFVVSMGKRPKEQGKMFEAQVKEIKKAIKSVKWDAIKPMYAEGEDRVKKDEKAAEQVVYKVVVMVKGKPMTTQVMNPATNKNVPEGIASVIKWVIEYTPPADEK